MTIPAPTALPAKFAGGWLSPEGGKGHGITAELSLQVPMWTKRPGTGRRTAAGSWNRWAWVRKNGERAVIHRCRRCGKARSNRVAADDNPMKLMSIALKPLAAPPFPLERIEELTALMGGEGSIRAAKGQRPEST